MANFKNITKNWETDRVMSGYPQVFHFNNMLDSSMVTLSFIDELEIDDYDLICLTHDDGSKNYYRVADYTINYATFEEPYKFNYVINLMSLTKMLEGCKAAGRSTTNIGQNTVKSIGWFIKHNALRYFKNDSDGELTEDDIEIPDIIADKTMPEMVLQEQTLRERLDTLYELGGCISKLEYQERTKHYKLKYIDLTSRKEPINRKVIDDMKRSRSAGDYFNSLDTSISNVVAQYPITEVKQLESHDYAFDSNNGKLITSRPIYDIQSLVLKKLKATIKITGMQLYRRNLDVEEVVSGYTNQTKEAEFPNDDIELTNFLVIDDIYRSLNAKQGNKYDPKIDHNTRLMNNTMYWSRGNNTIEGINTVQSATLTWLYGNAKATILNILEGYIWDHIDMFTFGYEEHGTRYFYKTTESSKVSLLDYDYSQTVFEITYTPYIDTKVVFYKKQQLPHEITMINNQVSNAIDYNSFSKQIETTLNQVGNESIVFTASVDPLKNSAIELGQTFDDYVVTDIEKRSYKGLDQYQGIMTKNYSNKNIYTAIDRTKRYYALANSSESIIRHENYNKMLYLKVSNVLPTNYHKHIKSEYGQFVAKTNNGILHLGYGIVDTTFIANTLTYTFAFMDNISYGKTRSTETVSNTKYGLMKLNKYVDNNGEFEELRITVYDDAQYKKTEPALFAENYPESSPFTVGNDEICLIIDNNFYKDNREIVRVSINYHIEPGNDNIILGYNLKDFNSYKVYVEFTDDDITNNNLSQFTFKNKEIINPLNHSYINLQQINTENKKHAVFFTDNGPIFAVKNVQENSYFYFSEE